LYFSYIKDYKGTIEVKKAIFFFETIQNLYIKGKSAGKPLKTNKLTILPSEKKNKGLACGQIVLGGVQN